MEGHGSGKKQSKMWPDSEHLMEVCDSKHPEQETQPYWSGNLQKAASYLN